MADTDEYEALRSGNWPDGTAFQVGDRVPSLPAQDERWLLHDGVFQRIKREPVAPKKGAAHDPD